MAATIAGWRGVVPPIPQLLAALAELPGTEVQLLRADRVHGLDHLRSAVLHADRAFAEGRNVATTWPLEVLRYAAGERQIQRALAFLGLAPGAGTVASVARGDVAALEAALHRLGWERDDSVLAGSDAALSAWGFAPTSVALLPPARRGDLVLERVALVDSTK